MRKRKLGTSGGRRAAAGILVAAAGLLTGCFTSGLYRTARVLEPGQRDVGLRFSGTTVTRAHEAEGLQGQIDSETNTYLQVLPEVSLHLPVSTDFEVGGRFGLSGGLVELDAKYRFVGAPQSRFHIAVQPAVSLRGTLSMGGAEATLPLLVTYDVGSSASFTAGAYGAWASFRKADEGDSELLHIAVGRRLSVGGFAGFEFRFDGFYLGPTIELARSVVDFEQGSGPVETVLTTMTWGLNLGWIREPARAVPANEGGMEP